MLRFITNHDVNLCIETIGRGPEQLLFLHGWISSRRMWYEVAQRLDQSRFTMHLLDFRGCGLSDRPPHGHHLLGYVSDLVAACNDIGAGTTLVAHSMGARVAQIAAIQHPQCTDRMILAAPGSASGTRVSKRRIDAAHAAFGSRVRIEKFQRAAMAVDVPQDIMARLVDDALVAQREVWFGDSSSPGTPVDFGERLHEIRARVLCLAGAKDPLAPPVRVKADVVARIPGALLVTLRSCGHNLPVEAPEDVAKAVERFASADAETRAE